MSQYQFNTFGSATAVTPSDTANNHFRALQVTVAGNLVIKPYNGGITGSSITFTAVPCGALIPIETAIVMSTGTTASVVGLF